MEHIYWIRLFKKFEEWEWYKDTNTKSVFIHCLIKANVKDKRFRGHNVSRGSFITGRKALSSELGLSEQNIRTALKKLELTNELTIKSTSEFSVITVVKYGDYQYQHTSSNQPINQQPNQQLTNDQPTTNQRLTTTKDIKNIDIKNKEVYIPTFEEFQEYAKEKKPLVDNLALEGKYNAWKENNWKDGHGKKIKNWKTKLQNTLPYLREGKQNKKALGRRVSI